MTVLAVLAVLESTLPSVCLSYKIQYNEATVAVLTVLAVSAVMAVSVMTATPLKLNPLFRDPEFSCVFQDLGVYRRLGDPEYDLLSGGGGRKLCVSWVWSLLLAVPSP